MHFFIFPSYNFKKEARKQTGHLLTGFFFVDGMHRRAIGYGETATVASQTYFFCLARKSRQKDAPGRVILRAHAREFLAAPRPERPLRAQIFSFPIAFGCNECTTRICGQTASTSVLLISGILGQSHSLTAYCRGGRPCPPVPLKICTTGEYADGLPFPWQCVLPSPCVATVSDGSVVSTQAAL